MLAVLLVAGAAGVHSGSETKVNANPIRRVVTMLQMMEKKVVAEGKKAEELFDKFMCYRKTGEATLSKSIADAETKIPQLESDIKEAVATEKQLGEDLEKHKTDREEAKEAIAKATSMREKEAAAFAKESGEASANIDALSKAIPAIEKGMAGGFLQTSNAAVLRRLSLTVDLTPVDRDVLSAFLTSGSGEEYSYAPKSGEILGILKQMKDTMEKDLAEIQAAEDKAKQDFESMMAAKEKEIQAATTAIEEKTKRKGEIAVELVNMKHDLEDTKEGLAEDKKFLADLGKTCAAKKKEWEEYQKTMAMDLTAIAETIKILNDDDALELFKKTLPSASALLQMQVSAKEVRQQALKVLSGARVQGVSRNARLDLLEMALRGRKMGFEKIIKMIDDLVALLAKEQLDDDDKKAWCLAELDTADDKKKDLERSISDLEKAIADEEES